MRRFLVVGCGGSGGATLAYLMDQLRSDLSDGGVQALPKGWQFVHIDVPTGEDRGPEGLKNVQQENGRYLGLGPQNGSYQILDNAVSQSLTAAGAVGELGTWAPRNPDTVMVPLAVGAGQSRALGRMITLSKATTIAASLNASWQDLQAVDTLSEMAGIAAQMPSLGPFDPAAAPIVLVVGSMAGGSGASMTLDVCRLLSQVKGVAPGLMGIFMVGADVFDSLPQASRPGVRPNAAAMFGEIVASQVGAARAHDVATLAALGLADGAGAPVPFARVFPVGRLMGVNRTPFGSGTPAEIFRALGRGLGSLMASPSATSQFVDWDLGNVTPPGDQDPIGWGLAGPAEWNPLPWAGFGFASLSMGRDRYGEYAAQRLAHGAVEKLMRGHLQPGNTASADAQMGQLVDSQWAGVLGGFGLPMTRSAGLREQDDAVSAWWTSAAYPADQAQAAAEAIYDGQLLTYLPSADGNPANSWKQVLDTTLADRRRAVSEAAERAADLWAFRWQQRLLAGAVQVIGDAIARHGLPYARKLLERLDGVTRDVGAGVAGLRRWAPPDVTALGQDFAGLLPKKNGVISNGRPLLDRVRQEMLNQIRNFIWGRAAVVGGRVLNSFAAEVVPALSAAVAEAQRLLEAAESEAVAPMGLARVHTEQVAAWPKRTDPMVNTRFDHAVNEVLLTTSAQYQGQFVADLVGSLPADIPRGVPDEALRVVVSMIISGFWPTTGADSAPGGLVEQTFPWRSRVFNVNPTNGESLAPAEPRFDVHTRPREILERARMYVKRPNESFDRFCQVSLRRFVAGTGASESQVPGRLREVEAKFRETLSLAQPLVGVNDAAVQAIHGHQVQYRYKFSNIPFDQHPVNAMLAHVVQIDSMIDPSTMIAYSNALNTDDTLKRIDVFGSYENFSPIVFESVLQPAAQQWGQTPPAGRKAFWEWRRARPLAASIPMTDVERRVMAGGWLLGQIAGLIRIPDGDPAGQPVRIYDRTMNKWVSFPFPLLTPPTEFFAPYDWLPAVLESVLLAISTAHQAPVLSSMKPYQLLRGIFDDNSQRPATGIVHSSASRLIPQWLAAGALAGADRSRVPGLDQATTVSERSELARNWLLSVQQLAEEFLPADDGGAPGGKSFSVIANRTHAAATPLFRDVAADVYWATRQLTSLFVAGEAVASQIGVQKLPAGPTGPPVPADDTTPDTGRVQFLMNALTIFLAPPGPVSGVLDVLRDLSSAGLLADFGWVPAESALVGQQSMVLISSGDASAVNVSQTVSARPWDRVRVCVLVPLLGRHRVATAEAEQALVEKVGQAAGHTPVERLRAVLIRPDVASEAPAAARPGWHNIVLSPEDAAGPDRGVELLRGLDHLELSRSVGPTLAGLTGLWLDIADGPLDGLAVPPGGSVRMGRTFYRRLDTADVERALLGELTDMTHGLPRPVLAGGSAVHIDNVVLATSTKAQELFTRFGWVLQGPRLPKPVQAVKPLGFGAALGAFFGYLWAALRGAPARWYAGMVGKVSSSSAKLVQRTVFGTAEVAYAVVVNGRTPDGRPADWLSRSRATAALESALYAANAIEGEHYVRPNLSDLWAAFVSGGLTLADGGSRLDFLPPVEIGPARGVVRHPLDVAPGPSRVFTEIPGALAAEVGFRAVRANDELGQFDLARRLKGAAAQSHLTLDAGRTLDNLDRWSSGHTDSYANQVGRYLSHYQVQAADEVVTLLTELAEAAGDEDIAAAEARRRKRMARKFRWLALLVFVPLVVVIVLTALGVVSKVVGGIIAVVLLLVFFIGAALSFYRLHRAFFADLHRRQLATTVAEVNRRNLREALLDVHRLTDAYREYLLWSDLLATVVAAPFGSGGAEQTLTTDVGDGLPQAARVATVPPEGAAVTAAAGVLARDAFPPGWLTDPWDAALREGWSRFGPPGDPRPSTAMYEDNPDAEGSALVDWTTHLAKSGTSRAGADRMWAHLSSSLPVRWPQQWAQLLAQVIDLSARGSVVPRDRFMAGVDGAPGPNWTDSLDSSALSSSGKVSGLARIGATGQWQRTARRGLDITAVLVQLTDGFPAYELDLGGAAVPAPPPPPAPAQRYRIPQDQESRDRRPRVDAPRYQPPQGPSF